MQDGFDPLTVVFIGLALFVAWRLRSVLGQKTGHEKPPEPIFKPRNAEKTGADNVVPLPSSRTPREAPKTINPQLEETAPRWGNIVEPDSSLSLGFDDIAKIESTFDARDFVEGAKYAYEMIVVAFAKGDRAPLKDLLTKDVFESFNTVIKEREAAKHTALCTFVGIDKVVIEDVQVKGKDAKIRVRIQSKLITATKDKDGTVIDGNPDTVSHVTDTWTFSRTLGSKDPTWLLSATGEDA